MTIRNARTEAKKHQVRRPPLAGKRPPETFDDSCHRVETIKCAPARLNQAVRINHWQKRTSGIHRCYGRIRLERRSMRRCVRCRTKCSTRDLEKNRQLNYRIYLRHTPPPFVQRTRTHLCSERGDQVSLRRADPFLDRFRLVRQRRHRQPTCRSHRQERIRLIGLDHGRLAQQCAISPWLIYVIN